MEKKLLVDVIGIGLRRPKPVLRLCLSSTYVHSGRRCFTLFDGILFVSCS